MIVNVNNKPQPKMRWMLKLKWGKELVERMKKASAFCVGRQIDLNENEEDEDDDDSGNGGDWDEEVSKGEE